MVNVLPEPVTPAASDAPAIFQPLFQATDGFRLIAGGTESGMQFERFTHGRLPDEGMSGRKVILLPSRFANKNTGYKNSGNQDI
jgi:hypothetical protein